MEGCYKVLENVNFENFLKVMGVPDDGTIQKMIQATQQVMIVFPGRHWKKFLMTNKISGHTDSQC